MWQDITKEYCTSYLGIVTPEKYPNMLEFMEKFQTTKTGQRNEVDDFEQLIGDTYLSDPYKIMKQMEVMTMNHKLFASPNRKKVLQNIYEKESYYRRGM
ncbi:hypothetical protein JTB14_000140 [Gonioctena quinquepunctata]|nr:hypothetical protein JTB14_000140 [Gonioctena quinquepunctata]